MYYPCIAELILTTAGESHGECLTAVLTGMPAGLALDRQMIDEMLDARRSVKGRGARHRLTNMDVAHITSGVRHGITLGSPIAITIGNDDWWKDTLSIWQQARTSGETWRDRPASAARPGHADLPGMARGGFTELRPVLERASARETAARTAGGALAIQFLNALGVDMCGHVLSIGSVSSDKSRLLMQQQQAETIRSSPYRCSDPEMTTYFDEEVAETRKKGDTLGGQIEVRVWGLPPGIGGYVTAAERLDGRLASAALTVPAIKAVEIGDGVESAGRFGSEVHDAIVPDDKGVAGMGVRRYTNRAGGIEGGMTNGEDVVVRAWMKPLPTLMSPLDTVDLSTGEPAAAHIERSDVCAVPAAAIVLEAVIALEIAKVIRADLECKPWWTSKVPGRATVTAFHL